MTGSGKKWHSYLISLLFVLVGAVFIAYAQIDIPFICLFFTGVFAVAGVVSILSYIIKDVETAYYRLDLVYGALELFAALVFFTKQDVVGVYFPVIIGFILFADGVIKLQHSVDMKRIDRKMKKVTEMWLVVMIFALACIAAGFVSVYLTPENSRTMFIFVGIALIVAGVSDVFTGIVFGRKVKLYKSGVVYEEKPEQEVHTEEAPVTAVPEEEKTAEAGNAKADPDPEVSEGVPESIQENEETVEDGTDPEA